MAENINTPLDLLRKLAKDKDADVKYHVASNPNTPLGILRKLTKSANSEVRVGVAENPNIPEDVLRELVKDESVSVRWELALNSNVSSTLLIMQFEYEKSLRYPDLDVIKTLYAHKNLPTFVKRVIETLFGDML